MTILYMLAAVAPTDTTGLEMLQAGDRWSDCVLVQAEKWAVTQEPVSVVVEAALSSCDREKYQFRQTTIRAHAHMKPAGKAMAQANAWFEGSEEGVRKVVTKRLLDLRAKASRAE